MTTYKSIVGQKIQKVSSDPTNPLVGQIWYNTTTGILKGRKFTAAAWASGGDLNTARFAMNQGAGTQTAGLGAGGNPSNSVLGNAEEYNGSTWSEETNIPTSDRGWGSLGLQTAAVMVGGATSPTTKCFEYDGSSWTTSGALTDGRRLSGMGCGTETAGLVAGGDPVSYTHLTLPTTPYV